MRGSATSNPWRLTGASSLPLEGLALVLWLALSTVILAGCSDDRKVAHLSDAFPTLPVPAGSTLAARLNVEERLFYDGLVSATTTISCSRCGLALRGTATWQYRPGASAPPQPMFSLLIFKTTCASDTFETQHQASRDRTLRPRSALADRGPRPPKAARGRATA